VEDYYDMPVDLLPLANFAGRPMSDISMLDGLWTMIISSSSSSSETEGDDEEFPARLRHNPAQAPQSLSIRPIQRPEIRISSPSGGDGKSRLRSLSNEAKTMERSQPRRKANTAPLGTMSPLDAVTAPQKPLPSVPGHRLPSFPGSFSQKLRVQKTLKQKQMGKLRTNLVNCDVRKGPNSANSMVATPRELYAIPEKQVTHDGDPPWPQVVQDTQSEIRGRRSWKRKSTKSIPPESASSAAHPVVQACTSLDGATDVKTEHLLGGPRTIYVPGGLCLEKHAVIARRDSVAIRDPFDSAQPNAHGFSELMVEDATAVFFEDLGVMEEATEASLDRYWLEISRAYAEGYAQEAAWRTTSIPSVTETAPRSPTMAHSLHGSRFSFSSASSSTSSPPMVKRPRTTLGRLLSPSNPGAVFLKTAGLFERQAIRWQTRHDGGG